ncbi:MAG: HAMP domain-containing histidine kinase [Clostridia bacterium]|nr:HAMP domain-containing histidine kinase [Clostridia bacterium]
MSIRVKLVLTYAILVVISAMILIGTGIAMITEFFTSASEVLFPDNNGTFIGKKVIEYLAELKYQEEHHPENLNDPKFIEELTKASDFFNGGVVVSYENQYFNFNEEIIDSEALYEKLIPDQLDDNHNNNDNIITVGSKRYFYADYTFNETTDPVTYYFLFDISNMEVLRSEGGQVFFGGVFIILCLIMVPLILILTKDIIKPIRQLKYGVNHIKNGDLDFELKAKTNNEIGEVIGYFDVMRRELKSSIEKQIQFEENRKELISSISHDLKTPITSIKGHIEGIRDGVANTPEKLEKYLNVIYQKSNDMDQLIDDLFLFSKLDLNKLPFEMNPYDFKAFIEEIYTEMKLGWDDDLHHINLSLSEEKFPVYMDGQKMKRVFVNIIHNAMKYMDKENQEIQIGIKKQDRFIKIDISDNGQGIPEEQLPFIFDRFYRVDESRNLDTGGTGLGLAIAKQIVEQHKGHIYAESCLGEGTTITILLSTDLRELNEEDINHRR